MPPLSVIYTLLRQAGRQAGRPTSSRPSVERQEWSADRRRRKRTCSGTIDYACLANPLLRTSHPPGPPPRTKTRRGRHHSRRRRAGHEEGGTGLSYGVMKSTMLIEIVWDTLDLPCLHRVAKALLSLALRGHERAERVQHCLL